MTGTRSDAAGRWRRVTGDSLLANSAYLMASTAVLAVGGFVFWVLAARLFPSAEVGHATAAVGVATALSAASLLGLHVAIIRFLPSSDDPTSTLNSVTTAVVAVGAIASVGYVAFVSLGTSTMSWLAGSVATAAVFVALVVSGAVGFVWENAFVAHRRSEWALAKNAVVAVGRVAALPACVIFGAAGIVGAYTAAAVASLAFAAVVLSRRFGYRVRPALHRQQLRAMAGFSFGNYLGVFCLSLPVQLAPLVLASLLGSESAAHFYVPLMVATVVYVVPVAVAQTLLAEASAGGPLRIAKPAAAIAAIALPCIIVLVVAAPQILSLFGAEYATTGTTVLRVLAVGVPGVALAQVGTTVLNVADRLRLLVGLAAFHAAAVLGGAAAGTRWGLDGAAFGWTAGQYLTVVAYLVVVYAQMRRPALTAVAVPPTTRVPVAGAAGSAIATAAQHEPKKVGA